MGFIIAFAVICILVLAFNPSKKRETITKTNQETGETVVETRVSDSSSAGQTAARIIVGIVIGSFLLVMLVLCASM